MARSDDPDAPPARAASPWEWALGAVSAVVVLGTVAFLLYEGLVRSSSAPLVEITVDSVRGPSPAGYVVHLRAVNHGSSTAADLHLLGELLDGDAPVESSTATIDFVPPAGERPAGLYFSRDPRRFELKVRATGFDVP